MRVGFDARVLAHGNVSGVERYTAALYDALGKSACTLHGMRPSVASRVAQHLWEHVKLPLAAAADDVLVCPANIAPLYLPSKLPLVLTLHDVAFLTIPQSFSPAFRRYYRYVVPRNIRRAGRIVTVSKTSRDEIIRFFPEAAAKIEVVFPGVDPVFRYKQTVKKRQILYVGSINERKNVAGVIEAFEMLKTDATLLLVGSFHENFSLSERTRKALKRARMHPNIAFREGLSSGELAAEYARSVLLVFPSFYEGFGLPVLEAMACGTPVVTSQLSSMPEVGAEAPLYCDPNDAADIAKMMANVLRNGELRRRMIEKGLERAAQFTWDETAKAYCRIFEEVVKC